LGVTAKGGGNVNIIFGVFLIAAGVLVTIFGGKPIPIKNPGWLIRLYDAAPGRKISVLLQTWVIGVLLIMFGLTQIFGP